MSSSSYVPPSRGDSKSETAVVKPRDDSKPEPTFDFHTVKATPLMVVDWSDCCETYLPLDPDKVIIVKHSYHSSTVDLKSQSVSSCQFPVMDSVHQLADGRCLISYGYADTQLFDPKTQRACRIPRIPGHFKKPVAELPGHIIACIDAKDFSKVNVCDTALLEFKPQGEAGQLLPQPTDSIHHDQSIESITAIADKLIIGEFPGGTYHWSIPGGGVAIYGKDEMGKFRKEEYLLPPEKQAGNRKLVFTVGKNKDILIAMDDLGGLIHSWRYKEGTWKKIAERKSPIPSHFGFNVALLEDGERFALKTIDNIYIFDTELNYGVCNSNRVKLISMPDGSVLGISRTDDHNKVIISRLEFPYFPEIFKQFMQGLCNMPLPVGGIILSYMIDEIGVGVLTLPSPDNIPDLSSQKPSIPYVFDSPVITPKKNFLSESKQVLFKRNDENHSLVSFFLKKPIDILGQIINTKKITVTRTQEETLALLLAQNLSEKEKNQSFPIRRPG